MKNIKIIGLALLAMVYGINASQNQRDILPNNYDPNWTRAREIITKEKFMIPLIKELVGEGDTQNFCIQKFGRDSGKNNDHTWRVINYALQVPNKRDDLRFRDEVYLVAAKFFLATDSFPKRFTSMNGDSISVSQNIFLKIILDRLKDIISTVDYKPHMKNWGKRYSSMILMKMGKNSLDENKKNKYYQKSYSHLDSIVLRKIHDDNNHQSVPKTNNFLLAELIIDHGYTPQNMNRAQALKKAMNSLEVAAKSIRNTKKNSVKQTSLPSLFKIARPTRSDIIAKAKKNNPVLSTSSSRDIPPQNDNRNSRPKRGNTHLNQEQPRRAPNREFSFFPRRMNAPVDHTDSTELDELANEITDFFENQTEEYNNHTDSNDGFTAGDIENLENELTDFFENQTENNHQEELELAQLRIVQKNGSNLQAREEKLNVHEDLLGDSNIHFAEEKYFKRTNVSGHWNNCFFNALGLKRKDEARKLIENIHDENVRHMIAGEIANAAKEEVMHAHDAQILSENIKKLIGYPAFKEAMDQINERKYRRNEVLLTIHMPEGDLSTESIERDEAELFRQLHAKASQQNVCTLFVNENIRPNGKMMNNFVTVENAEHNYTAIDAIAYLNDLALIIYRKIGGDNNKTQNLFIHHTFIPENAETIAHIFHSGEHYQHLFPVNNPEPQPRPQPQNNNNISVIPPRITNNVQPQRNNNIPLISPRIANNVQPQPQNNNNIPLIPPRITNNVQPQNSNNIPVLSSSTGEELREIRMQKSFEIFSEKVRKSGDIYKYIMEKTNSSKDSYKLDVSFRMLYIMLRVMHTSLPNVSSKVTIQGTKCYNEVDMLIQQNFLKYNNKNLALTPQGRNLCDHILAKLEGEEKLSPQDILEKK